MSTDSLAPEVEWDELAPGGEISATVMMMSGFVLSEGQRVRERYHIEGVIGAGAMGQVLAVKLVGSADQTTYALKVVARPVDANENGTIDPEEHAEATRAAEWFAELLRAEAAKQDQVQRHGVSVARLFALVQLDDGSIGMRMELARGKSLESWLDARKGSEGNPPETMWALQVVRKLVSQLRRLHEMADTGSPFGFVHSDIKPGNVFVEDSDATDITITLLDFGVATAGHALAQDISMRGGGRQTFVLQQTGGTIGYAPPMHFSSKATPLSDVYASLVILYELITLQFPWNYGEMELTPENIVMLETAMLRGPRPVRDVRPSIHHEDARMLDEFFSREFVFLNDLAERVHAVFGNDVVEKDTRQQQKLVERLAVLARDYQVKLDQLRAKLTPSRRPNAIDLLPIAPEDLEEKPTPLAIPKAPRAPRMGLDGADIDQGGGERLSPVPEQKPGKPTLMVMPSMIPPPAEASRARTSQPERNARERLPWILAGVGVPIVAAATLFVLRSSTTTSPSHATTPASNTAAASSSDPRAGAPTNPAVTPPSLDSTRPVAAADAALGVRASPRGSAPRTSVTLAEVRTAPETTFAAVTTTEARPAVAGAQACSCVASASGTRVVARGGTLAQPVTLCTADRAASDGRAEFYGVGVIPAEVFGALPQIECEGSDAVAVTVQRYASASGPASLFRCRRPSAAAATESAESEANVATNTTDAATGTADAN
jgi:serine/threonine protein kinase